MQTFLPYSDFALAASTLDMRRLGKQRVEVLQIVKALTLDDYGWKNHPATLMWTGHLGALLDYQIAICHEWVEVRGYKDTCLEKTYDALLAYDGDVSFDDPPWLGDERVHESHRSMLIQKNDEHYRPQFTGTPDNLEYFWPVPTKA